MRLALRAVAILIAAAALVDPAFRTNRRVPPPVTVLLDERDAEAQSVRAQLESALAGRVTFTDVSGAAAVVAIGDAVPERALASAAPLSTVALGGTPDVAIVAAPGSVRVHAGRAVALRVRLRGRGVAATTTTVGIEERGVELARVEHKWVEDGDATVSLSFFSPSSGVGTFEVRVVPAAGEHHIADNRVTVRALFDGRKPLIAMVEPRPSWPATFVRRVLEADRAFEVASIVRVSRGIATRGGLPPADISPDQLRRFDVVLVGAPEDLREGEVRALEQFAALRGGTVVLLPDRRPSGPYTAMLPAAPNEQLLTEPSAIEPSGVRASELLITPETRGSSFLATHDGRGVICRWPLGDGQLVFSGALDAWRFRGDPHGSFASFWRQTISEAAATAPPAVAIALEPAVVRPGQRARLTVRLRRSEFVERPDGIQVPAVSASIVRPGGELETVRLWPAAESGTFEADIARVEAGLHNIRATAGSGPSADTTLIVREDAAQASAAGSLDGIPHLSGGVTVTADRLDPLVAHLEGLPRPATPVVTYPLRSPWWMIPFAMALSAEWLLRRRQALR